MVNKCPKCGGGGLVARTIESDAFTQMVYTCPKCKISTPEAPTLRELISPIKPTERTRLEIPGANLKKNYLKTPAGKAAWERYRRSDLFTEAHARHRQTEKYAATQERFKTRRRNAKIALTILNGCPHKKLECQEVPGSNPIRFSFFCTLCGEELPQIDFTNNGPDNNGDHGNNGNNGNGHNH